MVEDSYAWIDYIAWKFLTHTLTVCSVISQIAWVVVSPCWARFFGHWFFKSFNSFLVVLYKWKSEAWRLEKDMRPTVHEDHTNLRCRWGSISSPFQYSIITSFLWPFLCFQVWENCGQTSKNPTLPKQIPSIRINCMEKSSKAIPIMLKSWVWHDLIYRILYM